MLKNTIAIFFLGSLIACQQHTAAVADPLILIEDMKTGLYSYRNLRGDVIIPPGKYVMCLTDTFNTYALVAKEKGGFIVIDRQEKELYKMFLYDNGPDYPSEGLFRIMQGGKIGYADAKTFQIVIPAQYDCAYPFEKGIAKVSNNCSSEKSGEYTVWFSEAWKYIDKNGKEVPAPEE